MRKVIAGDDLKLQNRISRLSCLAPPQSRRDKNQQAVRNHHTVSRNTLKKSPFTGPMQPMALRREPFCRPGLVIFDGGERRSQFIRRCPPGPALPIDELRDAAPSVLVALHHCMSPRVLLVEPNCGIAVGFRRCPCVTEVDYQINFETAAGTDGTAFDFVFTNLRLGEFNGLHLVHLAADVDPTATLHRLHRQGRPLARTGSAARGSVLRHRPVCRSRSPHTSEVGCPRIDAIRPASIAEWNFAADADVGISTCYPLAGLTLRASGQG